MIATIGAFSAFIKYILVFHHYQNHSTMLHFSDDFISVVELVYISEYLDKVNYSYL